MMKWFAGGQERKKIALKLLVELYKSTDNVILKDFFAKYIREVNSGTSIPYVLNAFNLEFSGLLLRNKIILNKEQSKKVMQLRRLSNIKYGNMY